MFPTRIVSPGSEIPEDENYFLVGSNGIFVQKTMGVISARVCLMSNTWRLRRFKYQKDESLDEQMISRLVKLVDMSFTPTYIIDSKIDVPEDENCFIIARNGVFLRQQLGEKFVTVKLVSNQRGLQRLDEFAHVNIPKVSAKQFAACMNFFFAAYKRHHAEAGIVLYYHSSEDRLIVAAPDQRVSLGSIKYENLMALRESLGGQEIVKIGTIHSHHIMPAYHSATDDHDEEFFDGLHITVGEIDCKMCQISCSVVINGQRFMFDPGDYIEGIVSLSEIEEQEDNNNSLVRLKFLRRFSWTLFNRVEKYTIEIIDPVTKKPINWRKLGFPKGWFDRLTHDIRALKKYLGGGVACASK